MPVPANRRSAPWILVAILLESACSGPPPPPPGPQIDPQQTALAVEHGTRLEQPLRVIFEWSVREPGFRSSGRGVARLEPPYRARLDLFTGGGETVLRAALVDDDLRIPPGSPAEMVPPPALFWSALGVFRPGSGSALLDGRAASDGSVRLRYGFTSGVELRYVLHERDVDSVDLLRGGEVVDQLALSRLEGQRFPEEATYRNLTEFRELRLTLDTVEAVEGFPPYIWSPSP